jgi:glycosyltransferase involved in cell wall biosynthesis
MSMSPHLPSPGLSILLPVYNVAPYVQACVESILSQIPAQGVEVLLLDDGSTDESGRICSSLAAAHPASLRVLVHDRNRGLSAARNTLLEAATGHYIWFVDSDDIMLPGAIPALQAVIDTHEPDLILCDLRRLGRDISTFSGPERSLVTDRNALMKGVFAAGRLYAWSRISRRELWSDDLRFPVGQNFEDIVVTPRLCLRARSFYHVPEPWIEYRVREGSITASVSRTQSNFDEHRNRELATAVREMLSEPKLWSPDISPATRDRISAFSAKKFVQIAGCALRAGLASRDWRVATARLLHYRDAVESCTPAPFNRVVIGLLRRGQLRRGLELLVLLLITRQGARRSPPRENCRGY